MFRCFSSIKGLVILALAVVVGAYLFIWHGQHVAVALPFLILAACPLMHIFMHRGHGGHGGHGQHSMSDREPPNSDTKDRR